MPFNLIFIGFQNFNLKLIKRIVSFRVIGKWSKVQRVNFVYNGRNECGLIATRKFHIMLIHSKYVNSKTGSLSPFKADLNCNQNRKSTDPKICLINNVYWLKNLFMSSIVWKGERILLMMCLNFKQKMILWSVKWSLPSSNSQISFYFQSQ